MTVKCIPLRSSVNKSGIAITYLCKLKPRPGPLNLEKCVAHGVPPGPLLGLLKNGIDVTLDNGQKVLSRDVSEPAETALSFVILDIPSSDYLSELQANEKVFQETQTQAENAIALVLHFSPNEMIQNNFYKEFVRQQFASETQHIYLNSSENKFSGYVSAHRIQWQLNKLHPNIFPLLTEGAELVSSLELSNKLKKTKLAEDDTEMLAENQKNLKNDKLAAELGGIESLNTLSSFHLRPRKGMYDFFHSLLNLSYV